MASPADNCTRVLQFTEPTSMLSRVNAPLMIILATFAVVVLACLSFQCLVLSGRGSLNPNFHLIFCLCNLFAWADCILVILFLIYHIHGVTQEGNAEYFGIPWVVCSIGLLSRFLLRALDFWLLFFGGLERFVQAKRREFTDPPGITIGGTGVLLGALSVSLISVVPSVGTYFYSTNTHCYCLPALDSPPPRFWLRPLTLFLVGSSTMLLYFVSFRISSGVAKDFHLDTNRHSLQQRFAVSTNIKLGRTLIVVSGVRMIGDISFALISTGIQLLAGESHEVLLFAKTPLYLSTLLTDLVQVCVQDTLHDTLRRRAVRILGVEKRGVVAPSKTDEIELDNVGSRRSEENGPENQTVDPVGVHGIISNIWEGYVRRNLESS